MFNAFSLTNLLPTIILLPIVGSFIIFFIPSTNVNLIRRLGLFISFLVFLISLFLWVFFDRNYVRFQFVYDFVWISSSNLNISVGVDGISIFFVLLTTLLIPICLLASWDSVTKLYKEYIIAFLIMESYGQTWEFFI